MRSCSWPRPRGDCCCSAQMGKKKKKKKAQPQAEALDCEPSSSTALDNHSNEDTTTGAAAATESAVEVAPASAPLPQPPPGALESRWDEVDAYLELGGKGAHHLLVRDQGGAQYQWVDQRISVDAQVGAPHDHDHARDAAPILHHCVLCEPWTSAIPGRAKD
eukprot:SAG11_NODE_7729_length_1103_cov_1.109562_1_plen_162_part_00